MRSLRRSMRSIYRRVIIKRSRKTKPLRLERAELRRELIKLCRSFKDYYQIWVKSRFDSARRREVARKEADIFAFIEENRQNGNLAVMLEVVEREVIKSKFAPRSTKRKLLERLKTRRG